MTKNSNTYTGETSARQNNTRPVTAKVLELLQERIGGYPIWSRAPKVGVCPWTSFSRSKLYELATGGLIRSVSIRKPGQTKGTRLFHTQSVLDYIAKCEQAANESNASATVKVTEVCE